MRREVGRIWKELGEENHNQNILYGKHLFAIKEKEITKKEKQTKSEVFKISSFLINS